MPAIPHASKFVAMATAMIAAVGLSLFGAAASSASTGFAAAQVKAGAQPGFQAKEAMTITGFDAKIAEAHGYHVFRFPDGTQVSVGSARLSKLGSHPTEASLVAVASGIYRPVSASVTPAVSAVPLNYEYGDCGDSYIFVAAVNRTWSLLTGYDVIAYVDDFDWVTRFYDPYGNLIKQTQYGNYAYPTGPHWEGFDGNPPLLAYTDETEYWKAAVYFGIAFLDNGDICTAGPPYASDETNDPK